MFNSKNLTRYLVLGILAWSPFAIESMIASEKGYDNAIASRGGGGHHGGGHHGGGHHGGGHHSRSYGHGHGYGHGYRHGYGYGVGGVGVGVEVGTEPEYIEAPINYDVYPNNDSND
jgi:hypothetical protein